MIALLVPPPATRATSSPGRSFRLIAYDYKQLVEDTVTYDAYHDNLRRQLGRAKRWFQDPQEGRPTLAFLPEDAGLMAWLVGPRGESSRQAADEGSSAGAVGLLAGPYAPQVNYYRAKCPDIPAARSVILAVTDTAWRAFGEGLARLAREWGIWILANINAPDVTVTRDPAKVAVLADPELVGEGYAYEGGCEHWNTAFLFSPEGEVDPDGAADPATVTEGSQKKVYLVPIEREQGIGLAMSSESPAAARAIDWRYARLGVLTSKDAWMPDVVERLEIDGMEVFLQPEAGPWAGHGSGLPDWPPDGMTRALWSMVQWQAETTWGALSNLTGNFGDLYFDGTATVVRDARRGGGATRYLLGRSPQRGIVARRRWVVPDPATGIALHRLTARRRALDAAGAKLVPGSNDPMENAQLSGYVVLDMHLPVTGPADRRSVGPEPSVAIAPVESAQWAPSLALGPDGRVHAAWTDLRDGFESPYVSSSGGGATWTAAVKAGDSSFREFDHQDNQYDARIAVAPDGTLHLVWLDFRNQSWDVRASSSTDGGATWSPSVRVDGSPSSAEGFPAENLHQDPAIAVLPDGTPMAAWSDARGRRVDRGIRVACSDDAGASWAGDASADRTGKREADQWAPALAVGPEGEVVVAWQDHRRGWNQVYAAVSVDGGRTFGPSVRVARSTAQQWQPAVAVGPDGRVGVAFSQGYGDRRIRVALASFRALGNGELPKVVRDVVPGFGGVQARPAVAFRGHEILVAWQELAGEGLGDWDVLVSPLGSGTIIRVDDGPPGSHARLPAILVTPGRILVAWEDTRSGIEQVRVASLEGV